MKKKNFIVRRYVPLKQKIPLSIISDGCSFMKTRMLTSKTQIH